MRLDQLLGQHFQCECGKTHAISLKTVHVGPDASAAAAEYLTSNRVPWSGDKVYLIADTTTFEVAGRILEKRLQRAGFLVRPVILEVPLVPDEVAVEKIRLAVDHHGVVIAVGAGTIHDLARFVATEKGLPLISVPTAPSVDGFASSVSPLIVGGQKKTFPAQMPIAVFADLDVLSQSPPELIAAGYADIVGKTTSLADWALSNVINDEWICPRIVHIVSDLTKEVVANRLSVNLRGRGAGWGQEVVSYQGADRELGAAPDQETGGQQAAVATLMQALILSGLAIDMAQSSRPASGSEHHMSHYWEMRGLWSGVNTPYHGAKVGVATVMCAGLYEWISGQEAFPDFSFSNVQSMWQQVSHRVDTFFGPLAGMIKDEIRPRYDVSVVEERLRRIRDRWSRIQPVLSSLMFGARELVELLKDAGAPTHYDALALSRDWALGALVVGKEIRDRYTILQFADDLALLDRAAEEILDRPST